MTKKSSGLREDLSAGETLILLGTFGLFFCALGIFSIISYPLKRIAENKKI